MELAASAMTAANAMPGQIVRARWVFPARASLHIFDLLNDRDLNVTCFSTIEVQSATDSNVKRIDCVYRISTAGGSMDSNASM
jgi:hypothetical protein